MKETMSSSCGKRKAEMQEVVDSGDSGEGEMEMEKEKGGSSSSPTETKAKHCVVADDSKEWEWGYDSFEGRDYLSLSDDVYSDDESNRKHRAYRKQYFEHKGFYIDPKNIPWGILEGIHPCRDEKLDTIYPPLGKTERQHMADIAKQALQTYNQINGTNVTFESVKRVNQRWGSKVKSYVTILAKENPEDPPVDYHVKIQRRIKGKDLPIFCRPAPSNQKLQADLVSEASARNSGQ